MLCAFMLAAPFVVLGNLPRSDLFVAGARFEGILELWHIESFEGGVGSRAGWLKKRSTAFEKQNKGCLVNVTVLTPERDSIWRVFPQERALSCCLICRRTAETSPACAEII